MQFCQKLEQNDIVGCGIIFSQESIFYTLNGRLINTAFTNIDLDATDYHAAVSFGNGECSISANFGATDFKFGVEDMLSNSYQETYNSI